MAKVTRKVWALESGFSTDNAERDEWFQKNPVFVVTHSKKTRHLVFAPLAFVYAQKHERDDMIGCMSVWETTTAKKVEESNDGSYRCYETANGTRYHIYLAGELSLS